MKQVKTNLLWILLLATVAVSCKKEIDDQPPGVAAMEAKDVAYGSNAAQKMDVYLPANRTAANTKTVVLIHGGSWSGGDKNEFDEAIAAIKTQLGNYALFNINYRLAGNGANQFPAQINDVQAALDFIKTKSTEYLVNADVVGLIGASAGAHLALLQAYRFNSSGRVKAVVDLFGPTDLTDLYYNHPFPSLSQPVIVNFLGTTPAANATLYQQASPINYVTAQSPPTQIFHGSLDIIAPIAQSLALKARLEASGAKVEMTTYPTEGHGWIGNNLLDTYAKAVVFIQQNVK